MPYFKYVVSIVISLGCVLNAQLVWGQTTPQNYPNKTVKIIVPFAPGGPTDVQGRWAAEQLSQALGQAFIVENQGGGGGVPATDKAVKSVPDGYTLLAGNPGPLVVAPAIRGQMPYNTLTDLEPIMLIARSASCVAVHPSVPARNVKEFIAYAKANPGKINYGSPGIGTIGHLGMERFTYHAGIVLNHVPYKGAAQYLNDLLAGHIQIAFIQFGPCIQQIKQGKLFSLGATSEKRSPLLPDMPTIAEQGLSGYSSYNWNGLLAPKGTPAPIINRLYEILSTQLATKENQDLFINQGHEPGNLTPEGYRKFLQAELNKNAELAKAANIKE